MLMTICVGASPPPIELARAAACPARFARLGRAGLVFRARLLPSLEPYEIRVRFSHSQGIICRGKGGVFGFSSFFHPFHFFISFLSLFFFLFFLALSFETLAGCVAPPAGSNPGRAEPG